MERERTFNPSACGSKPPGSATRVRQSFGGQARRKRVLVVARRAKAGFVFDTLGPVTVEAERRGLLTRWRKARRRFESCLVLHPFPSWPCLSRPSTSLVATR